MHRHRLNMATQINKAPPPTAMPMIASIDRTVGGAGVEGGAEEVVMGGTEVLLRGSEL